MSSFRYRVVLLVGQRGRGVRLPAAQPNYKHFLNQNLQLPRVPPLCFQAVNDIIISWQRPLDAAAPASCDTADDR